MEVKKHRLLLMIQQPPSADSVGRPDGVEMQAQSRSGEGLEGNQASGDDHELIGKKCRAPLEEVSQMSYADPLPNRSELCLEL